MEYSTTKLHLTIHHREPIVIKDLYESIRGIAKIYRRMNNEAECNLYIDEINKGSIDIVFIVGIINQILFVPNSLNILTQFYNTLKGLIQKLKKANGAIEIAEDSKIDVKHLTNLIRTAGNTKADVNISLADSSGAKYENCSFTYQNLQVMDSNIKKLGTEPLNTELIEQALFRWSAANFDSDKVGNKAIIYQVSEKPVKVIFDKHTNLKKDMTCGNNWQDYHYIVDVVVTYDDQALPRLYKIIRNYPEDSFLDDA